MQTAAIRDWVSIIKDLVLAGGAAAAAVVAWRGLQTWRRQLLGQSDYALSKKILMSVYTVREEIRWVRLGSISESELAEVAKNAGIEDYNPLKPEHSTRATAALYAKRWASLATSWSGLKVELLEAEAVWGSDAIRGVRDIESLMRELHLALVRYCRAMRDERYNQYLLKASKREKIDSVVYDEGDEDKPDDFGQRLNKAISEMEAVLRPKLSLRK